MEVVATVCTGATEGALLGLAGIIAGAAIGATNTFDTALLLLMDVTDSQANDDGNHR